MTCNHAKFDGDKLESLGMDPKLMESVLEKYDGVEGSLITILQKAQEIYGYLSAPLMEYIAYRTNIKLSKILGVATFYTQFRFEKAGKYQILLCKGTACHVNGAESIEEALREALGVTEGQTTKDGLFTYNNVACLGCCSLSPVMMINGETYGKLTPDAAKKAIMELKESGGKSEVACS